MSEKIIDIICFAHDGSSNGLKITRKKYIVKAEKAQEKVREIMAKLLEGEIDAFTVCLRD